jgi:hypothetical protein
MRGLSFSELAFRLMSSYVGPEDIPADDLKDIVNRSYTSFRDTGGEEERGEREEEGRREGGEGGEWEGGEGAGCYVRVGNRLILLSHQA